MHFSTSKSSFLLVTFVLFNTLLINSILCLSESEQSSVEDECENYVEFKKHKNCKNEKIVWYFSSGLNKCVKTNKLGCSNEANFFSSEEQCNKKCGAHRVCRMKLIVGDCRADLPRYFFNNSNGQCEEFSYKGCGGNLNRFKEKKDCLDTCDSYHELTLDLCLINFDSGHCGGGHDEGEGASSFWYLDPTDKVCKKFKYCNNGGNRNRFRTKGQCEMLSKFCKGEVPKRKLKKTEHRPNIFKDVENDI